MKILKCDLCDFLTEGETFEEWMNNMKPHYAESHADLMKEKEALAPEEQRAEMMQWMEDNRARFKAAPDHKQKPPPKA